MNDEREDRWIEGKMSPERDITPLLGSKLPQLRLGCFPVYKIINIGIRVIGHVYFFWSSATMFTKEKKGALLSAGTAIFIGRALKFFMAGVVPETLATPLGK